MIPVKEMFPNGDPETMEITDSRGRKLKTFLDKKQDLLTALQAYEEAHGDLREVIDINHTKNMRICI